MKTPYSVLMKYAGMAIVVLGGSAIFLSPFYVMGRAHEKNSAYLAVHHNVGRRLLVLGDCKQLHFLLTEQGDCFVLHADDPDKTVPLADHEIVELGDGGPVIEAILDSAPVRPSSAVKVKVLSGGYLSDFVRVPREALIISLLVILGGIALIATGNRQMSNLRLHSPGA